MPTMLCRVGLLLPYFAVQAFQFNLNDDAASALPGPDSATKRLRHLRIFHGSTGWVPGRRGTNTCPHIENVAPATQEECQAIVDLSPVGSLRFAGVRTSAESPKGCFYYKGRRGNVEFSYNEHPSGSGSHLASPVCKSNDFLIGKGRCPKGTVPVQDPDVCMGVQNSFFVYKYKEGALNSSSIPLGCVGHKGQSGIQFNAHAEGGFNSEFYVFCVEPPEKITTVPMSSPETPSTTSAVPVAHDLTPGSDPSIKIGSPVSAKGDPHMTTMAGVKFDITRQGKHLLIQIALPADSLLLVSAEVQRVGLKCEDMYIKGLNVTGKWADQQRPGGFSWVSANAMGKQVLASRIGNSEWKRFGPIDIKVVRGNTSTGIDYLNMKARHLREASRANDIGGILGLDDHGAASTPEPHCKKVMSLLETPSAMMDRSFAEASL